MSLTGVVDLKIFTQIIHTTKTNKILVEAEAHDLRKRQNAASIKNFL